MPTISFITANFVARALDYNGVDDWAAHDKATVEGITPERFMEVAQDVIVAGFDAIDVWTAHCHWRHHDRGDYLEQIKGFCSQFDLTITSYAGGVEAKSAADIDAPLRFMKQLGAPMFAGGIWGPLTPAEYAPMIDAACKKYGVRWALENHPEKTVDEIFARIDGGRHERLGVALDTGWCGTQGLDALEATKQVLDKGKLFILHLKDVKEAGKHDTCAIGEGIVPCEAVVRYLAGVGWKGDIAIEHEPYDRDPMPEIERSVERVRQWLRG